MKGLTHVMHAQPADDTLFKLEVEKSSFILAAKHFETDNDTFDEYVLETRLACGIYTKSLQQQQVSIPPFYLGSMHA
jgi:hypothetical protein